jgi:putative phosphonate metabolism protein
MDDISRFALYIIPEGPLGTFGEAWLGWDAGQGRALPPPADAPPGWERMTAEPRRYGFHATIKPPFRLAPGMTADGLHAAVAGLCAGLAPVVCDGLSLAALDGFLALLPDGDTGALDRLAARVVTELDPFRRPAPPEELARRRAACLTPRQEAHLLRWGYPYVMDDFRAHFTLTGRLEPGERDAIAAHLGRQLSGLPLRPLRIDSLCLAGEQAGGGFRRLHRYPLSAG